MHASRIHHRIDKGEVPMVHYPNGAFRRILQIGKCNCSVSWHIDHKTKQKRAPRRANMGETKAWQPTGTLTKKHTIPITITDEAERAELQM
jgi:hypothetical protein